ncbi:MAG: tetratricopeptide repeat protein, partial [Armatimonadetes bacterium]|nr:tetratricopeptide repeat protein [Armatimonadota bacterium]
MILNSARRMGVGAWCALLFLMVVMASGPARAGRAESEAYLNAAKAAIEKNDVPGAINSLNSAIAADPANDRPYAAMAEVYEQLHSYDIAAEKIQKAAQLNPGYAPYWVDLGRYEKLQKHYDKAIEALNRAANLDKKSAEIPYQLAMVYYDKNDLDDAEKAINKAVEADDSNLNYKLWRARIRYHVGKGDAAESELSSIVTRLKATKGQVYDDASKLLTTISQEKRKKLIQKYALIGVPAAVLVVAAVVLIPMLRRGRRGGGGGGGGARMDLTGDATTFEDISAMALRRLCSMTQMSHGVMFVTTIDGDQMDPKASVVLDPDELKPVGVDVNELPRWIERNDGKPFLFNVEKKEGV